MAWLAGYGFRKKITISTANADADLPNFPVYVPIVSDTDIGGECLATGYDVRFTDSSGDTELYHQRLGFSVSAGSADGDFYVRVTTVSGSANTDIYCYYGDADATDGSSATNTFQTADGWNAVWHLEESAHPYADATGVNNSTSATAPTRATGAIAYGQDFNGTAPGYQHIHVGDNNSLDLGTADFTISFWFNADNIATEQVAFSHAAAWPGWYVKLKDSTVRLFIFDNTDPMSADGPASLGAGWHFAYITCDRDNSSGGLVTVDGTAGSSANPTAVGDLTNAGAFEIGAFNDDSLGFDGILDEIRILGTLKTAAWGKFEFYNSNDGHASGNELTWAAEESSSTPNQVRMVL